MVSFLSTLQQRTSRTARTENDAVTHSTSHNAMLDFFALAGAMRDNERDAIQLMRNAYAEEPLLAVRNVFYIRDIRGGQGERKLFRTLFLQLPPLTAAQLYHHIPRYGRWDDLIAVAPVDVLTEMVSEQLIEDEAAMAAGESVSLLAKWLPSENTSSPASRRKAHELMAQLGLSEREYRKRVVALRKYITLLEHKMSANQWSEIEYEKLPSQAGRKHTKAFKRHDAQRYDDYLEAVMSGEKKMNAGTLFTYEVMDAIRSGSERAADAMWKSLPDMTNGSNAIVVADVSGSMTGRPMDVSVSLALYFAERNQGPLKGYFITFSEQPQLVAVRGSTLAQKLFNIQTAHWDMNTNVEAVFHLILEAARGADPETIPKVIYIISDMQFDSCVRNAEATNFENAQQMFAAAGLELPHVVFWNVNARDTNVPVTKHDNRVTLISGLSQSTFRYAVEGKTPEQSMLEILNGERYQPIVLME